MCIDIGATSKEEVINYGVKPGDSVVPYFEFTQMKNEKMLLAKAFDNRIGCAIAIDVLKGLQNENHPNTVYGVGTVQEEVGLRGAGTSAHMIEPDIGFNHMRSEEHTSELQSRGHLVCRLLLEKKNLIKHLA